MSVSAFHVVVLAVAHEHQLRSRLLLHPLFHVCAVQTPIVHPPDKPRRGQLVVVEDWQVPHAGDFPGMVYLGSVTCPVISNLPA
jgi:hypothetical protein